MKVTQNLKLYWDTDGITLMDEWPNGPLKHAPPINHTSPHNSRRRRTETDQATGNTRTCTIGVAVSAGESLASSFSKGGGLGACVENNVVDDTAQPGFLAAGLIGKRNDRSRRLFRKPIVRRYRPRLPDARQEKSIEFVTGVVSE